MEAAQGEVAKLPPGAVVVTAMKFTDGTAQELINWQKREGYKFPVIAYLSPRWRMMDKNKGSR